MVDLGPADNVAQFMAGVIGVVDRRRLRLCFAGGERQHEVDRQRKHHGAPTESEQDQIIAAGVRINPGKAVGRARLKQRKAGGGVAPCRPSPLGAM